jgi:hypothetical protein
MYSPDYADHDPRNPANFAEVEPTSFYIDPNQFLDDDAEVVGASAHLTFQTETDARQQAFAIARLIAKPVTITPLTDEGKGWFEDIIVKPTVKLA